MADTDPDRGEFTTRFARTNVDAIRGERDRLIDRLTVMTAERDYLRTKLSTPGHAHIDGAHLSGLVDGCLLCDAMKERDRLRADLSLASGHADALREQLRQVTAERDRLRAETSTPNSSLPPIGDGPRREVTVTVSVPANWQDRLDMQWVLEREIHADRWRWEWPQPPQVSWAIEDAIADRL